MLLIVRNSRSVYLLLVALLKLLGVEGSCSYSSTIPGLQSGQRLVGSAYLSLWRARPQECARFCSRQRLCSSFNWGPEGQCELNHENVATAAQGSLTVSPEWIYVTSSDMPKRLAGACETALCGKDERCAIDGFNVSCMKDNLCFKNTVYYMGRANITVTGTVCQRWETTTPHRPVVLPESLSLGDPALAQHENYCREDEHTTPWCYTVNPSSRWEDCGVPLCSV